MLENIEIALEEHHVPHGLLPGTNLAWKDIGFMPDVEGESKKNERNGENVVRNQ